MGVNLNAGMVTADATGEPCASGEDGDRERDGEGDGVVRCSSDGTTDVGSTVGSAVKVVSAALTLKAVGILAGS